MRLTLTLLLFALLLCPAVNAAPTAALPKPVAFGVASHSNVNIEWWYVNAHVTTDQGRHLALIGSFFRFGNGFNPLDGSPAPRAHYLIYAVTDLDTKTQRAYSLADRSMTLYLQQLVPFLAASNPQDPAMRRLAVALQQGALPSPHQTLAGGTASVTDSPFRLEYGQAGEGQNSLASLNAGNTAFALHLGGARQNITDKILAGQDEIRLTLTSQKPPMAVGGKGETGLKRANDMYYFSLTRCAVGGTVDTGSGPEKIIGGQGWLDHQWGNSWVASNNGWDWWGVQLDDGTDILFFRQRDLQTGRVFFPLATFMDKNGRQSVTKKIVFIPDPKALWKSAKSGVTYPLGWTVAFPEKNLRLRLTAAVQNQEMPILGPGGGIWEGLCRVTALPLVTSRATHDRLPTRGVSYMELVGYSSPAVKRQVTMGRPGKGK